MYYFLLFINHLNFKINKSYLNFFVFHSILYSIEKKIIETEIIYLQK